MLHHCPHPTYQYGLSASPAQWPWHPSCVHSFTKSIRGLKMSLLTQIFLQVTALSKSQPLFWKVWMSGSFGLFCSVPGFGVSAVTAPPTTSCHIEGWVSWGHQKLNSKGTSSNQRLPPVTNQCHRVPNCALLCQDHGDRRTLESPRGGQHRTTQKQITETNEEAN